jgi:transcriptional regulator with GAF, ATPase, and Fis domain
VAPGVADSDDPERDRIVAALARHAGNQAAAAADLGIARRTLLYKLDRLGIPRPRKVQETTSAGKKR